MTKSVNIRMYNVGFGDCFLITLPGKRTILVDAGFHAGGVGEFGGNDLAEQIIADVEAISGSKRIDVVIGTHRHRDHVYAFSSDRWEDVEVGEVWLPWVEDPSNKKATSLWKKQSKFAANLFAAMPGFALTPADEDSVKFMLWNAGVEIPGFDAGGWSNKSALDRLCNGFKSRDRAKARFLPEKEAYPESFETGVLPRVRIHVLGPARDPELIEELDPEDDGETYKAIALRAAAASEIADSTVPPFGDGWSVGDDESGFTLEPDTVEAIRTVTREVDAVFAAEKVDGMINSTSLVLILELGKLRLLLPGDAEWGTWKRILNDEEAVALLKATSFFKVGHHGSHNATSKTLVDILPSKISAMISTQQGDGTFRNNIPLRDLLDAMTADKINYVRSDEASGTLPKGFKAGEKWVDLTLEV
jgi:beta-lactamase superfamily II metal-dependent hydrolase